MRSVVNTAEEDQATDIGNTPKKLVKIARVIPVDILADRQTDTQTDILTTILRNLRAK